MENEHFFQGRRGHRGPVRYPYHSTPGGQLLGRPAVDCLQGESNILITLSQGKELDGMAGLRDTLH
jgi:hypothetical protein